MIGKIKWFNNLKGFGFIQDIGDGDIFVHYSAILTPGYKRLHEGEMVEFDLRKTSKGYQAMNVKSLKKVTTEKK